MNYPNRKEDERIEGVCGRFLDQNFYPRLNGEFERNNIRELQYKGVDVSISCDSTIWVVDEKAKYWNCTNTALGCPSFELTRRDKIGRRGIGWYAAKDQLTNAYFFISPFLEKGMWPADIVDSNLTATQVLMVPKKSVEDFVKSKGFSTIDLLEKAEELAQTDEAFLNYDGKAHDTLVPGEMWLTYSSRLTEQPVNLVIPREILKKLKGAADRYITKDKIEKK